MKLIICKVLNPKCILLQPSKDIKGQITDCSVHLGREENQEIREIENNKRERTSRKKFAA